MLTNSREFEHPQGVKFKTPLLVPSFSSKGFSLQNRRINKKFSKVSELYNVVLGCRELFTESLLVSAYDLYYKLIPPPQEIYCTDVTIIDSGGYETSQLYDFSGINKINHEVKKWEPDFLDVVISKWPREYPSIIVNYDHGNIRQALEDQITNAKKFFKKHGNEIMSDFLIKPETKDQTQIQVQNVISKIHSLSSFDVIGLTEKEMGDSILNRMVNISKIRGALDGANINRPIHIFGSLDPITSILYFFAGAEIFDGLTWLKFSYHGGVSMYTHNYAALNKEIGIHIKDIQLKIKAVTNNLTFLERLKYVMMDFHATCDFSVFEEIGGKEYACVLEKGYNRFNNIN